MKQEKKLKSMKISNEKETPKPEYVDWKTKDGKNTKKDRRHLENTYLRQFIFSLFIECLKDRDS